MSQRNLPRADMATRPSGIDFIVQPSALDRWNPEIRAAEEDGDNVISILDYIGENWDGTGVTARRIAAALRTIGERDVVVNVNSPGGSLYEGIAIYNQLREHKGRVMVNILGIAASAAGLIAMSGDDVLIARSGFLMMHNSQVYAGGDRNDLRAVADWLEPFDAVIADIFAARSGIEAKEIAKLLDKTTYLGGAEAVKKGFADDFLASDQVKNVANAGDGLSSHTATTRVDALLAAAGLSRKDRRALIGALKSTGTPRAAEDGMSSAAVLAEVEDLLASMKSI
jgi:ATP-dependent protease ClpP protease subunit